MWSVCRRVNNHVHLWKVNTVSHTPGPWRIIFGGFESDDGFGIGTDNAAASRVKVTAECWPCTIIDQQHRAELSANARLIAAAPDLLAALVGVVRVADRATVEFDAARAAIAKAKGAA